MRHYFYDCHRYYFDSKYYFQSLSTYFNKYFDEYIVSYYTSTRTLCGIFGEMNSSNLSYDYTLSTHVYYGQNWENIWIESFLTHIIMDILLWLFCIFLHIMYFIVLRISYYNFGKLNNFYMLQTPTTRMQRITLIRSILTNHID